MFIHEEIECELIGIYLEHNSNVSNSCLNQTLFSINEPFYMQTESQAKLRNDRKRKRKNKTNDYDNQLNQTEKRLIGIILDELSHDLCHKHDNNSSAKQLSDTVMKFQSKYDHLYRDSFLCNGSDNDLIYKQFVIPSHSSFMCCDVTHGLELMQKYFQLKKFSVSDKLIIIIDPPWSSNKSVKRKRTYATDNHENIRTMCEHLKSLIQLFSGDVRVCLAIWTTNKEKLFVLNQMLPLLDFHCTHCLLWHKITRTGESAKLRGGLEYLILASKQVQSKCINGVLLSIPSAIHSHKPPLKHLIYRLVFKCTEESSKTENNFAPVITTFDMNDSNSILDQTIYSNICGIELYARYLNVGFHSIGFEVLKLQNKMLYSI